MRPGNSVFAVALMLACCIAFASGCQGSSWYLSAKKKGDSVQLCLSNEKACPQPGGVSPSLIAVYRYDSTHDNELVWSAEPENPETGGTIGGVFMYGVPPKFWVNQGTAPAPALVCGKAYLVNPGTLFFALRCDGTVTVFDFQQLDSFFRENTPLQPVKKTP
jgi:hypothetical protein